MSAPPVFVCGACHEAHAILHPRCIRCGAAGLAATFPPSPIHVPELVDSDDDSSDDFDALEEPAEAEEPFAEIDAPLVRCLDGRLSRRGELALVTGPAGAGKSTESARAARKITTSTGSYSPILWIDAGEMHDHEIRRVLANAGLDGPEIAARLRITRADGADDVLAKCARAFRVWSRDDLIVIILDSLHDAAESERDRIRLLAELRKVAGRGAIVFVIAHANDDGDVYGSRRLRNKAGAIVKVTRENNVPHFEAQKCRWHPISSAPTRAPARTPRSPERPTRSASKASARPSRAIH